MRVLPTKASSWDLNPRAEATVGRRDAPPYCPWICVFIDEVLLERTSLLFFRI